MLAHSLQYFSSYHLKNKNNGDLLSRTITIMLLKQRCYQFLFCIWRTCRDQPDRRRQYRPFDRRGSTATNQDHRRLLLLRCRPSTRRRNHRLRTRETHSSTHQTSTRLPPLLPPPPRSTTGAAAGCGAALRLFMSASRSSSSSSSANNAPDVAPMVLVGTLAY